MTTSDRQPQVKGGAEAAGETMLSLDDGEMYVRQDGPGDAPVLLLIHGTAVSAASWHELVPLLTVSHRVVRVDLLGHGRSAVPAGGRYGIPEQGRRVGVALDRLGVEHAVVVGHSSGGTVATALAEQRPDLVTALVLIDTGPGMHAYIAPESAAIGPSQWPPSEEEVRRLARTAFRADFPVPQEFVDEMRGTTFQEFAAIMQAPRVYLEQQALPERLMPLGKPLQVIFGDQDARWRPESAADYRAVAGARVDLLPGVGHTPILEDPPGTAALLLAFAAIHAARAD